MFNTKILNLGVKAPILRRNRKNKLFLKEFILELFIRCEIDLQHFTIVVQLSKLNLITYVGPFYLCVDHRARYNNSSLAYTRYIIAHQQQA